MVVVVLTLSHPCFEIQEEHKLELYIKKIKLLINLFICISTYQKKKKIYSYVFPGYNTNRRID